MCLISYDWAGLWKWLDHLSDLNILQCRPGTARARSVMKFPFLGNYAIGSSQIGWIPANDMIFSDMLKISQDIQHELIKLGTGTGAWRL